MNLALKYRPGSFKDLIGQEILVRILQNAFSLNKIPQSIVLIGSSGIGKTTTARIISLCLNCISGPTAEPCGTCSNCISIKNSSHPDVIEIDAASNTGIDDIKVILENSHYLPISAKFKVYIIDEVHMLSNSAFNALLKTLEEPAPHVKFILATTEVRKIPATIISRCLRFDLQRISVTNIIKQLQLITANENIDCDEESLKLIANHAEGSMRNALFLLEQASSYNPEGNINIDIMKNMLGCVDRNLIFNIFSSLITGDLIQALQTFAKVYEVTNPVIILDNMLEFIHEICLDAILHKSKETSNESFTDRIKDLDKKASSPIFLSRLWQALLKGIQEVKSATCVYSASEMLIIRLCYLSDLPSPQQIIKKIQFSAESSKIPSNISVVEKNQYEQLNESKVMNSSAPFTKVLNLLKSHNQFAFYNKLCNDVELIDCGDGFLMLKEIGSLAEDFSDNLSKFLNQVTQEKWFITIQEKGSSSLVDDVSKDSVVQNIMKEFSGAKVVDVTKYNE